MKKSRLFVIGLDGVPPEIAFYSNWNLPNISRLCREGIWGHLESTVPPITIPAWLSMVTGLDPGQLGIYGFHKRCSHDYSNPVIVNSSHIQYPAIWDYLNQIGLSTIVIGIPPSYPPKPVNGLMVSCFLTPSRETIYTYPVELAKSLDEYADGKYMFDVSHFRSEDKKRILDDIYKMTKRRFSVVRGLLRDYHWDFFMFVEIGTDRLHHAFWHYHDPNHPLYVPGHPLNSSLQAYYEFLDQEIGKLLSCLPEDSAIMVVSDHGARSMIGTFSVNDWLIKEGYLTLKMTPPHPVQLSYDMIDFKKTLIWADGGYCARIHINLKGREPEGQVEINELDSLKEELSKKLNMLISPNNEEYMKNEIYVSKEIYMDNRGVPPDLTIYFDRLGWRASSMVGHQNLFLDRNDTGPDGANHSKHGIIIFWNGEQNKEKNKAKTSYSIYDITPTILDFFNCTSPFSMRGRSFFCRR